MSHDTEGQEQVSPWTRPWFVIAAAVVVLLVVLALVLAVIRPETDRDRTDPAPAPTTSASTAAPPTDVSTCGLEAGDQAVPAVPPVRTDWELVGTVAAPTAPETIGPGVVAEGLRSCFARSPLGALYAAANFLATTSDPGLRLRAAQELTAAGEGRDRALDLLEGADPGGAGSGVQVAGFTFLNYDPASAVVDVAMTAQGAAVHLPVSLRWEGGDWKVLMPPTGQIYEAIAPLPNLTGYVPWSGA